MNFNDLEIQEELQEEMILNQIGELNNKIILDFGYGNSNIAKHYSRNNKVTIIRFDSDDIIKDKNISFTLGGYRELNKFQDNYFDIILCHNIFEYSSNRKEIMKEFSRIIKDDGILSILKHNRNGQIMKKAVLFNNFDEVNSLLDGNDNFSDRYGRVHYYNDDDLIKWCNLFYIEKVFGQGVFYDLQQNKSIEKDDKWRSKMIHVECRVSEIKEYRDIASFHHVILKKKINKYKTIPFPNYYIGVKGYK